MTIQQLLESNPSLLEEEASPEMEVIATNILEFENEKMARETMFQGELSHLNRHLGLTDESQALPAPSRCDRVLPMP